MGPNIIPPNDGTDILVFTGSTRLTPNANQPWDVTSIEFNDTVAAGNFVISGSNDITLSNAATVTNNSAMLQTISTNLISDVAAPTITSASNDLMITGNIQLTSGGMSTLTIDGAANTTVSGVISGSMDALAKSGAGTGDGRTDHHQRQQ